MMTVRLGVRTSFPKPKPYLKAFVLGVENWATEDLPRLRRYAREGSFEFRYSPELDAQPYNAGSAKGDLTRVANALRWQAIQSALTDAADWRNCWFQATAYGYWSSRMELSNQRRVCDDYHCGRRPQYLATAALHRTVFNAANALNLGWFEMAVELVKRTRQTLDIDGFFDGDDEAHRRTQHFVVRLVGSDQGWPERCSPRCAYDEPLFEELIARWREPDASALVPLLLAACDRHTHEARVNSRQEWHDLSWMDEWYVPFEVLAVLRLRERRGLANPGADELNHPLLRTPLGVLPPAVPPYHDDLLQGLMHRVRMEYPAV